MAGRKRGLVSWGGRGQWFAEAVGSLTWLIDAGDLVAGPAGLSVFR